VVGDLAHPGKFFIEFATLHSCVLFPLVVRQQSGTDFGLEGLGSHEQTALHHQLRKAYAPEESGLPSLVRAGDDDKVPAAGVNRVGDDRTIHGEGKAHVIQSAEFMLTLACRPRDGKGNRYTLG